jgi:hypothetical protein
VLSTSTNTSIAGHSSWAEPPVEHHSDIVLPRYRTIPTRVGKTLVAFDAAEMRSDDGCRLTQPFISKNVLKTLVAHPRVIRLAICPVFLTSDRNQIVSDNSACTFGLKSWRQLSHIVSCGERNDARWKLAGEHRRQAFDQRLCHTADV